MSATSAGSLPRSYSSRTVRSEVWDCTGLQKTVYLWQEGGGFRGFRVERGEGRGRPCTCGRRGGRERGAQYVQKQPVGYCCHTAIRLPGGWRAKAEVTRRLPSWIMHGRCMYAHGMGTAARGQRTPRQAGGVPCRADACVHGGAGRRAAVIVSIVYIVHCARRNPHLAPGCALPRASLVAGGVASPTRPAKGHVGGADAQRPVALVLEDGVQPQLDQCAARPRPRPQAPTQCNTQSNTQCNTQCNR